MADKIDVESGNPYRDQSGHFATSPDQALTDSFKKLQGKKFVPKGKGSNRQEVESRALRANELLANLRNGDSANGEDSSAAPTARTFTVDDVDSFDLTKLTDNETRMILWRDKELFPGVTYGDYYRNEKNKASDIYMLTPQEYKQILIDSGKYKSEADIDRRMEDDKVYDYSLAMEKGAEFPVPNITIDGDGYVDQEGLHRVYAAEESGTEYVPVALSYPANNKPDWIAKYDSQILDMSGLKIIEQTPAKPREQHIEELNDKLRGLEDVRDIFKDEQSKWHVTEQANKETIDSEGFKPAIGPRSEGMTNVAGVWMFPEHNDAWWFQESITRMDEPTTVVGYVAGSLKEYDPDKNMPSILSEADITQAKSEGYVGFSGTEVFIPRGSAPRKTPVTFIFDETAIIPRGELIKMHEEANKVEPEANKDTANANWKPSGTEAEANEFAKDSVIKDTLYHGTDPESAASITDGGFNLDKSTSSRVFGNGVYITGDKATADWYAGKNSKGAEGSALQMKVNVKNPYIEDMNDFSYRIDGESHSRFTKEMYEYGVETKQWKDMGDFKQMTDDIEDYNNVTRKFADHLLDTHDAIIQTNSKGIEVMIVKDPKNIMVINNG